MFVRMSLRVLTFFAQMGVFRFQDVSVRLLGNREGRGYDRGGARRQDCDGHSEETGLSRRHADPEQGDAQVDQGQKQGRQVRA